MRHAAGGFCMSPSEDPALAGIALTPPLLGLQPFAVKARYSAEETPLPADRTLLLNEIEALANALEARLPR